VRLGNVVLAPELVARDVRAVLRFEHDELAIEKIDGTFAGGRIAGGLMFQRTADGLAMRSHVSLAGAQAARLLPGDKASPISGRVTLDLDLSGTGRSPTALIGALKGRGTFTLTDGQIAGLDPKAFATVVRSVEQGLPIDARRVGGRMDAALRTGMLIVPLAEGELSAAAGQLRITNAAVRAQGADLAVAAGVSLANGIIRARLTLTGPAGANAPGGARPEVMISLRGPIGSPERSIDASGFANWLALRAIEEKSRQLEALEKAKRAEALKPRGTQIAPAVPYTSGVPFATTAMPGKPPGAIGAWWERLIGP
jgi:large subunit ribosomal protein L24